MASATVRDFRCNGCGAPLKIPNNSRGQVTCPSCKTESIIEGLVKNAEMAAKENIASGIPLTASPSTLHRTLVNCIADTTGMPLDVFENGVVVREEHHCVPAFFFHCNGTASYTCDAGTEKEKDGDSHQEQTLMGNTVTKTKIIRYIEWTPMSGNANASGEVVASGNRDFSSIIRELYLHLDQNQLYDFDELNFPHDVITHSYNLPQTAAFNENAKPYMESLIKKDAERTLANRITKDLAMGSSRIEKETVRIFLGLYRLVFQYGGKEYSIWVTGDGKDAINEGMPVDTRQKSAVDNKRQSMEQAVSAVPQPTTTVWTIGMWVCIIVGVIGFPTIVLPILGIIGAIVCHIKKKNIMTPYNEQVSSIRAKHQSEINALEAGAKNVVHQFRSRKQPLRGIYEQEVAGDASAF